MVSSFQDMRCLICRNDDPSDVAPLIPRDRRVLDGWTENCLDSLFTLFQVPTDGNTNKYREPLRNAFAQGFLCKKCLLVVRDVDLTLRQLSVLLERTRRLRHNIRKKLEGNYNLILDNDSYAATYEDLSNPKNDFIYTFNDIVKVIFEIFSEESDVAILLSQLEQLFNFKTSKQPSTKHVLSVVPHKSSSAAESFKAHEECTTTTDWQEIMSEVDEAIKDGQDFMDIRDFLPHIKDEKEWDDNEMESDVEIFKAENQQLRPRRQASIKALQRYKEKSYDEDDSSDSVEYPDDDDSEYDGDGENIKDEEKPFRCTLKSCGIGFKSEERMLGHYRKVHENDPLPFHCKFEKCNKKFKLVRSLEDHLDAVHTKNSFPCEICSRMFYNDGSYLKHMQRIHNIRRRRDEVERSENPCIPQVPQDSDGVESYCDNDGDDDNKDDSSDKPFSCPIPSCNLEFKTEDRMLGHKRKIHEKDPLPYKCRFCKKALKYPRSLEDHIKVVHLKTKPISCTICEKSLKTKSSFVKHMQRHRRDSKLNQNESNAEADVVGEALHAAGIRNKPKTRVYNCAQCPKSFMRNESLKGHIATVHDRSITFTCQICNKSYFARHLLNDHKRRAHNNRIQKHVYLCSFCGLGLPNPEELELHENSHKNSEHPYSCLICEPKLIFTNSLPLKSHVALVHTNIREQFICDTCGAKLGSLKSLAKHSIIHEESYVGFKCDTCDYVSRSKSCLERHKLKHLTTKAFICEICGASFTYPSTLNFHKRTHNGDYKYVCKICGAKFVGYSFLTKHEEIHSGTMNYHCKFCPKKFKTRNSLNQHEKTHLPKDPNKKPRIRKRHYKDIQRINSKGDHVEEVSVGSVEYDNQQLEFENSEGPIELGQETESHRLEIIHPTFSF